MRRNYIDRYIGNYSKYCKEYLNKYVPSYVYSHYVLLTFAISFVAVFVKRRCFTDIKRDWNTFVVHTNLTDATCRKIRLASVPEARRTCK